MRRALVTVTYNASVTVRDRAGNTATTAWTFVVQTGSASAAEAPPV